MLFMHLLSLNFWFAGKQEQLEDYGFYEFCHTFGHMLF